MLSFLLVSHPKSLHSLSAKAKLPLAMQRKNMDSISSRLRTSHLLLITFQQSFHSVLGKAKAALSMERRRRLDSTSRRIVTFPRSLKVLVSVSFKATPMQRKDLNSISMNIYVMFLHVLSTVNIFGLKNT